MIFTARLELLHGCCTTSHRLKISTLDAVYWIWSGGGWQWVKAIEEFVQEVDERREEAKNKAEEEAEPDDDGWVTISRKSKKKSTLGAGRSEKVKARLKAREAKKRKNRELRSFYKFQLKETKLKKLSDLREKFEADKERQRKMIADRKFKPS